MAEAFPSFDYEAARLGRALDVADDFNFAFDVVGKRGREKDKTALIAIERTGETVTHHSYSDLDQLSNRFANALMTLGAEKGDFAFVMIPRIVEWYQVLLGCTKTGVVAMPGTNLLTAKDIEYRQPADARLAIVTAEHAERSNRSGQPPVARTSDPDRRGARRLGDADGHVRAGPIRSTAPRCADPRRRHADLFHQAPPRCPRWSGATMPMRWRIRSPAITGWISARTTCTGP